KRARVSSYVGLGWQVGVLLAALVTPVLLTAIGWRGVFLIGLVPALLAFVVRRALHEPEIFVTKHASRKQGGLQLMLKDRNTSRTTLGVVILCSVQNFGYYGMMTWMPSYLENSLGFSLTKSAAWTSITILGMAFGIWTFGQLADQIGRKPIFLAFQVGAVIMVLIYSQLTNASMLLWVGAIMGMFVNGMLDGIGALISEAYPTEALATAKNILFDIARGVRVVPCLTIGALDPTSSSKNAHGLFASFYGVEVLAHVFLIP